MPQDEDIRRRVVEAGAIPLLVGFLSPNWLTNIMPSTNQLLVFRWSLQTLTHLTRTRDYRDTVSASPSLTFWSQSARRRVYVFPALARRARCVGEQTIPRCLEGARRAGGCNARGRE